MLGLESGRIHEHELCVFFSQDAGDAMPRGLCLAGSDADLLPDQMVKQGGLAYVGASHDGDEAAMKWCAVGHGVLSVIVSGK